MELSKPGSDLLGGPEAGLLLALSRLARPVSGREAARLAGISQSTARRALARLSRIGLIDGEEEAYVIRYSLNRHHALWAGVQHIFTSPRKLDELVGAIVARLASNAITVFLFGSVARGDATAESDIDIAVILPDDTEVAKSEQLVDVLAEEVESLTGNRAQVLTLSMSDLRRMMEEQDPLVDSWLGDARTIAGTNLPALITQEHDEAAHNRDDHARRGRS